MKEKNEKKPKERPKYNMWQNSAYMIREAWRVRKSVLVLCLSLSLLAVATSLAELYIAPVILRKVEESAPLPDLLLTILCFTGLLLVFAAAKGYLTTNAIFGRIKIRLGFIENNHYKLSTTSFPNTENTDILKKLEKANMSVNYNSSVTEAIWNTFSDLLKSIIGFVIYLSLLTSLEPALLAVVLITTIAGYFVNKRINEWSFHHRDEEARLSKKMWYVSRKAEEPALSKDIRVFGMQPWLTDVYVATLCLYEAFAVRREKAFIWANVTDVILSLLRNGAAYFYLIVMAINSGLPASQFLLYFAAVGGFTAWVTGILSGFSTLHTQSLDLSILREYLETPEPFRFSGGKPLRAEAGGRYSLTLRNVSFRYPGAEADTLRGVNLTVGAGEKLAIVGLNGAGKTTLVKLLCGFYDPTEGSVLLNGTDIREYNRADYYLLFAAVFQQFSMLEATLAENVAQTFDEAVDLERVKDCVGKAGLTEKAESLPARYETHIGRQVYEDGIELSGGETQRLMLARALYKEAPIIVLDEPTAALDPIAENDIYLKYNEMTAGRTAVYISHRLASTRFCDRIVFLADGGIAEEGSHDELLEQGGLYADLFAVQSRYYKEGSMVL